MHTELQLILTPEQAEKKELLQKVVSEKLGITSERITLIRTLRKSIDARGVPKINRCPRCAKNQYVSRSFLGRGSSREI